MPTKQEVDYRPANFTGDHCGECKHINLTGNALSCDKLGLQVVSNFVCDLFEKPAKPSVGKDARK